MSVSSLEPQKAEAPEYVYEEIERMASDDIYDELCNVRDIKSKQPPRADRRSMIIEVCVCVCVCMCGWVYIYVCVGYGIRVTVCQELKETERSYLKALVTVAEARACMFFFACVFCFFLSDCWILDL
jgi:hypothetical protein